MPCLLAPCWKKPFSEQLSGVQVKPESQMKSGTLLCEFTAWGGRYRLKAISQPVVLAL